MVKTPSFSESDRSVLFAIRDSLRDTIQPYTDEIAAENDAFEGIMLFAQDPYHSDSAASVVSINRPDLTLAKRTFQDTHVTNRRIALATSTLGGNFYNGSSDTELVPSKMNPNHSVAGIYIPPGKYREPSVLQMAYTTHELVSEPDLGAIQKKIGEATSRMTSLLDDLYNRSARYPTGSIGDALKLDTPTVPNSLLISWDIAQSTRHAGDNYPNLRDFLTLAGEAVAQKISPMGGEVLRPTGDGQLLGFTIPYPEYDTNDPYEVGMFLAQDGVAIAQEVVAILASFKQSHPGITTRITAGPGCVEETTFDKSSPGVWELSQADAQNTHNSPLVFTRQALQLIALYSPSFTR